MCGNRTDSSSELTLRSVNNSVKSPKRAGQHMHHTQATWSWQYMIEGEDDLKRCWERPSPIFILLPELNTKLLFASADQLPTTSTSPCISLQLVLLNPLLLQAFCKSSIFPSCRRFLRRIHHFCNCSTFEANNFINAKQTPALA